MFVDHIEVFAKAGKGGDGSAHFYRGKFRPKGGPDGGDGGKGGSIILHVDPSTSSLRQFFFNSQMIALDGQKGSGNKCSGRSSEDKIFRIPCGTIITKRVVTVDEITGEETISIVPVADLSEPNTYFTLCKGGKGGKGNVHFKTSTHQAPKEFVPGEEGEEGHFQFELRSMADAGLVGFPNAGKSTLLTKLSSARPKIGSYPFTTLKPIVGVVDFGDGRRASIADIPGLIEGASDNVGLGHDFLRHIMRCRVLLFVVDTGATEGRDPITDLKIIRKEVKLYSKELYERDWCIVANKIETEGAEKYLKKIKTKYKGVKIIPISALEGTGIKELKDYLNKTIAHDTIERWK
jgi:GTPase